MVSISCIPTDTWSIGFNASLKITNSTNNNYGANWIIVCDNSTNNITWCDNLNFTINSKNIVFFPKSFVSPLNAGTVITANFGGIGTLNTKFTFQSSVAPTPPSPITPPLPPSPITPPLPPSPIIPSGTNSQRRVVYIGYWLSDSDIPRIVSDLKGSNITHALLTFIVQPDSTKPLTGANTMLDAFKSLSTSNQKLLTSSFKVGISLGGALQVPVPYSLTFCNTTSYYYNNPQKYAGDYFNLVKGTGLEHYFDLDIEGINDKFNECATFIGEVCKELKRLNPLAEISHAPQQPYFCSNYGNVYDLIYKNYKQYFTFLNIQNYNNGPSNSFEQIFITSYPGVAPLTSVSELINRGYDPSYIVVGKTIAGESDSNNGYIPLEQMAGIVKQAFQTPSLNGWSKSGGLMIWYYNCQGQNENNTKVLNYFKTTSQF